MADLFENPLGLDGFEFIEFCAPERGALEPVFTAMGFNLIARHRSKDVAALAAGRHQSDRQLRAEKPGCLFRRRAWPGRLRHGLARARCREGL